MVQFNLLPDVKMQYIKAKRQKHTMLATSILVAASALAVFILLFVAVNIFQTKHLSDLSKDIADTTKQLKDTPDLNKVLTIQNQLGSLPTLHGQKPVTSRLFGFIAQLTPNQATIGNMSVDFTANKLDISGTTDSLSTINKFVDTLKFTTYTKTGADGTANDSGKPFKNVVMASFGRGDKDATYQISFDFDPAIFDASNNVALVVPKIISTRSETEKPTELFKAIPQPQAR